jgi:DNA-binding NtrC family response regulator
MANSAVLDITKLFGASVLVVEPEDVDRRVVTSTLTSFGLHVTATDGFSSGRASLAVAPAAVLVTEHRLGAYNGLHLALIGRSARTDMMVIVTSQCPDLALQRETEAMGGTVLRKPVTTVELVAALYRSTHYKPRATRTGEWIHPPSESSQLPVARPANNERRRKARRREIATFLLREALRR